MSLEENPAATMELTLSEAHKALTADYEDRHGALDKWADVYEPVVDGQQAVAAASSDLDSLGLDESGKKLHAAAEDLGTAIAQHVLDEHAHAVRWTLDAYDEIPYDYEDAGHPMYSPLQQYAAALSGKLALDAVANPDAGVVEVVASEACLVDNCERLTEEGFSATVDRSAEPMRLVVTPTESDPSPLPTDAPTLEGVDLE